MAAFEQVRVRATVVRALTVSKASGISRSSSLGKMDYRHNLSDPTLQCSASQHSRPTDEPTEETVP